MPGVENPENDSDAGSAERSHTNEAAGPHTDRNPGAASNEPPAAASGARMTSSAPPPASSDTLLSLPTPASREDLAFDERVSACERQIEELSRRVQTLERRGQSIAETPERGRWMWLVFLAALALVWQIISLFR